MSDRRVKSLCEMEYGPAGWGRHDEERDVLGTWVRTLSDNFGEI